MATAQQDTLVFSVQNPFIRAWLVEQTATANSKVNGVAPAQPAAPSAARARVQAAESPTAEPTAESTARPPPGWDLFEASFTSAKLGLTLSYPAIEGELPEVIKAPPKHEPGPSAPSGGGGASEAASEVRRALAEAEALHAARLEEALAEAGGGAQRQQIELRHEWERQNRQDQKDREHFGKLEPGGGGGNGGGG